MIKRKFPQSDSQNKLLKIDNLDLFCVLVDDNTRGKQTESVS